jgi:cytoskeletal protein RodZ
MASAGELLRCERSNRNRTLSEIAKETCICSRYLQAIEDDHPEILPGDFFHRSFIRQYAQALKLDEAATRRILDAVGPAPDLDPLPVFQVSQQIAEAEHRAKPLAQVPTRVAAVLFLVVMMGCSGLYALWNRALEAADPAMRQVEPPPATSPQETRKPVVSVRPPSTPPKAAIPAPVPTEAAVEAGQIDVDLAAKEKTWVSLSAAGRTVYSGLLEPSEPKSFAIAENARLLTGNAAGLDVKVNGRAVGPIGPRGQVRIVLLAHDHFEVLTPRKM